MITKGNSGMATAGSGDVLTGIAAAMLFGVKKGDGHGYRAAQAAAFIHAEAGDAARDSLGERSMIAGDLIRAERGVFRLLTE
jgi:NAD(P)H-hydrate epimerase